MHQQQYHAIVHAKSHRAHRKSIYLANDKFQSLVKSSLGPTFLCTLVHMSNQCKLSDAALAQSTPADLPAVVRDRFCFSVTNFTLLQQDMILDIVLKEIIPQAIIPWAVITAQQLPHGRGDS